MIKAGSISSLSWHGALTSFEKGTFGYEKLQGAISFVYGLLTAAHIYSGSMCDLVKQSMPTLSQSIAVC